MINPDQKQATPPFNTKPEVNTNQSNNITEEIEAPASSASASKNRETQPSDLSPLYEEKMEINSTDILNLYRDHANIERAVLKESSDIRQEDTKGFGDVKYAIATGNDFVNREILQSTHNNAVKVDEAADKIQQRATDFYISSQARDFDTSRDLAALRAQVDLANQKISSEVLLASERAATAAALESARLAAAVSLGQSQLSKEIAESKYETSKQISLDGEKTRELVNSLKTDDLNRLLIERNTDLAGSRHDYWVARDGMINSQLAALSSQVNSQVNALNSQVAETRQGMVNFGTMAGVGQSSTSNAVR